MEENFQIEILQDGTDEIDAHAECTCTSDDTPACCCVIGFGV